MFIYILFKKKSKKAPNLNEKSKKIIKYCFIRQRKTVMREVAGSAGADGYVLRGTVNTLPVVLLLRSPWYCWQRFRGLLAFC